MVTHFKIKNSREEMRIDCQKIVFLSADSFGSALPVQGDFLTKKVTRSIFLVDLHSSSIFLMIESSQENWGFLVRYLFFLTVSLHSRSQKLLFFTREFTGWCFFACLNKFKHVFHNSLFYRVFFMDDTKYVVHHSIWHRF